MRVVLFGDKKKKHWAELNIGETSKKPVLAFFHPHEAHHFLPGLPLKFLPRRFEEVHKNVQTFISLCIVHDQVPEGV